MPTSEAKRGCGYRKIGGKYLIGGGPSRACGRFPFPLHVCPVCNGGIKQTRGFTWIRPVELFKDLAPCDRADAMIAAPARSPCGSCPVADVARLADESGRCGLLWVGEQFYPTVADFTLEAARMGVCRRVTAFPKGIKVGAWVLLAHPKAVAVDVSTLTDAERDELNLDADTTVIYRPGVFSAFQVTSLDVCVSEQEFADEDAMEKLREKGLTPVALPDDPKHRGSVYDKGDDESPSQPDIFDVDPPTASIN